MRDAEVKTQNPCCAHAHAQCGVMLCSYCISSLNACFTVKFDGSYYGDKVIWTGLCSRTLLKWSEYSNISCLITSRNLCHSFYGVTIGNISAIFSTVSSYPGGPTEDADRLRMGRLQGKSTGLLPALLGRGERRPTIWTTIST